MLKVFYVWIMISLVSISSDSSFQVDLNTSPSASLNKARKECSYIAYITSELFSGVIIPRTRATRHHIISSSS